MIINYLLEKLQVHFGLDLKIELIRIYLQLK